MPSETVPDVAAQKCAATPLPCSGVRHAPRTLKNGRSNSGVKQCARTAVQRRPTGRGRSCPADVNVWCYALGGERSRRRYERAASQWQTLTLPGKRVLYQYKMPHTSSCGCIALTAARYQKCAHAPASATTLCACSTSPRV